MVAVRQRYYPSWRRIVLLPLAAGLILSVPIAKGQPWRPLLATAVFALVFVLCFLAWRRILSVEIGEGRIRGRNPITGRSIEVDLFDIDAVHEAEFVIGRIKGWSVHDGSGRSVFVNAASLEHPELKRMLESRRQG
jgi:hypothetical protein